MRCEGGWRSRTECRVVRRAAWSRDPVCYACEASLSCGILTGWGYPHLPPLSEHELSHELLEHLSVPAWTCWSLASQDSVFPKLALSLSRSLARSRNFSKTEPPRLQDIPGPGCGLASARLAEIAVLMRTRKAGQPQPAAPPSFHN